VIESVTERLKTRIEEGHIAFERSGESGITVNAHRGLLEQAVFNLMDNALKYGSDGRYLGVCTKANDNMAYISVTDHGRGIPERDKPRMFERFYRVDKARSRESGGTGLGLAIVKHIALAHAGSVSFSSTEGKGTIFTLTIPAADTN
jgi:signal transduction histidine kinase